ncbi:MarR family winged helix-turn-helix transcriptional regulator [Roseiarcus sp.]|jgi:DNA-binding MarR family transcriptional regulator|uniref:MarR family winged helix-turn-helix transcriptional regulator n=1 Tax=Roseiarcus sp. TaxID=1969460 RepID=UPI003F9A2D13
MQNSWFTETEVFLLHEIVARLDRLARRRVLDARGVSYPEFLVAMAVRELPEPTHGEVGELLDMSKSLVSQRVSALLAKGIVEQRREQPDRRHVRLALTVAGRETLEAIYREMAGNASALFDGLGGSREPFRRTLAGLRDALVAEEAREADNSLSGLTSGSGEKRGRGG